MNRTMLRALLSFAAGSILLSCAAAMKEHREYYANRQVSEFWTEVRDSVGNYLREGKYTAWHENGQERIAGQYHRNLKTGLWTVRDTKGELVESAEYVDGKLQGISVSYHPNKKKKQEGKYVNGLKEGSWRQWYADGSLKEEGVFVGGKQEGTWTAWYPGFKKRSEIEYQDGKMDGLYLSWRESGLRWEEGHYQDGLKSGAWTVWNELGLVFSQEQYLAGKPVEMKSSAENH